MADQTLADLFDMLGGWKHTNFGNSPGTYIQPNVKLDWYDKNSGLSPRNSVGYVNIGFPNTINLSRDLRDQIGMLSTLAHEAAHTEQPNGLMDMFFGTKGYGKLKVPYSYYDNNNGNPPVFEILASLRENEAMAPKGTSWWQTTPGEEYLTNFKAKNPDVSINDMVQMVDRQMFPKNQVMHESPTTIRKFPQVQGFLQQLMNRFR